MLKLLKKDVEYGIIFGLVRFKKGIEYIDRFVGSWIKYFEKISYYFGLLIIPISVFILVYGIIKLKAMFSPLIPGIEVQGIYIPIFPTIIAVFIVAFIHEFSHAILIRYYGLRLKSWGIFFLGPFLGAFVEPDENEIKRENIKRQIAIYNAGSISNIIAGFLFFVLILFLNPLYTKTIEFTNVTIISVIKGSPAYISGIRENETILYINDKIIHSIKDVHEILKNKKPGDKLEIVTNKGRYLIKLGNKDGKPYIGVYLKQNYIIKNKRLYDLLSILLSILNWLFVISVGIGIANLLPIYPLDGGRSIKALLEEKFGEKGKIYSKYISLIILILLLINISFSFIL